MGFLRCSCQQKQSPLLAFLAMCSILMNSILGGVRTLSRKPSMLALILKCPAFPAARPPLLSASGCSARKVSEHTINARVRNVLNLLNRVAPLRIPERAKESSIDTEETADVLYDVGAAGIVLCKKRGEHLTLL